MMPTTISTPTGSTPSIQRQRRPGIELAVVTRQDVRELHLTLWPLPGERASVLLWRLDAALREHQASIVRQEIFGSLAAYEETINRQKRLFGEIGWPILWTEGASCAGGPIGGTHVLAIAGAAVDTVRLEGRVVGRTFNDGHARHCLLGDILPADVSAAKEIQAAQVFENIEAALDRAGMNMKHVIRTWLFLDDILSWYGPLNAVRKKFFQRRGLLDGLMPASTGVGVTNPARAAMVAGAWAVQPADGSVSICEVDSPRQGPAPDYGSCFSRAVELGAPDYYRVLISGTASIEPSGRSARVGDLRGQINLTMSVVEALLVARDLGFSDVTRATAYFKDPNEASLFQTWCDDHRTSLPALFVQADICRDELLFEIELDAIGASSPDAERLAPNSQPKNSHKPRKGSRG
jgi:enamine deaminase RidA (YjgF/YER057c/UK114 family)